MNEQNKRRKNDNYDDINKEQLKNIKSEFEEKYKIIDTQFQELKNNINEIKTNQINVDEELKIDENYDSNIFERFENLLPIIIDKGYIDSVNYEKLKKIVKQLNNNQISSSELVNKYFSEAYKYSKDLKYLEKLFNINKLICKTIEKIEDDLNPMNKNMEDQNLKSKSKLEKIKFWKK